MIMTPMASSAVLGGVSKLVWGRDRGRVGEGEKGGGETNAQSKMTGWL